MRKIFIFLFLIMMTTAFRLSAENAETAVPTNEEAVLPAEATEEAALVPDETAKEAATPGNEETDVESDYTFGTVSKINKDEIVIKEFDEQSSKEIEASYKIAPDVEWENVQTANDVKAGDYVEIDYTVENGAKVASFISVESMSEESPKSEEAPKTEEAPKS